MTPILLHYYKIPLTIAKAFANYYINTMTIIIVCSEPNSSDYLIQGNHPVASKTDDTVL